MYSSSAVWRTASKVAAAPALNVSAAIRSSAQNADTFAVMVLPEVRGEHGKERDREEDADEGQGPGEAERAPVELRRQGDTRPGDRNESQRKTTEHGQPLRRGTTCPQLGRGATHTILNAMPLRQVAGAGRWPVTRAP